MYTHIQYISDKTFFNKAIFLKMSKLYSEYYLILWISEKNPILNLIYKTHLYFDT